MIKKKLKKDTPKHTEQLHSFQKKSSGKPFSLRGLTLGCLVVFLSAIVIFLFFSSFGRNIVSVLSGLVFQRDIQLTTSDDQTLNLLLLGIGGGVHEGPDLTDTIIFAHIDRAKQMVDMISIPRDLWIPQMSAKINSAYAYGLQNGNRGFLLADAVVEKVVGQPIDYTIVVDFEGFVKLVDLIGGIDVDVKRTFTDTYYPIPGKEADLCDVPEEEIEPRVATASSEFEVFPCRYEEIHFEQGMQIMDGARALLFVRSRHAQGDEGTDFARSKRQNQVIAAVKSKVLSLGTLANPVKVLGMISVLQANVLTNISQDEYDDFIKLAQKMQNAKITHSIIDIGDEKNGRFGLVENPEITDEYKFQWVLIPRKGNGDFSEIQEYVKCIVKNKNCEISKEDIKENKALE